VKWKLIDKLHLI